MGVSAGPRIETDGLVFALDAKNTKTFDDIPGITDHGISDWYCFTSGTATYSAIYPNTEIIEIDADGNETVIVTTGSDPQRGGSVSVTAGKRYYGTKAIHILSTGANDAIAPVSFAGTYFGNIHTRYNPKTMRIYAPQDDINVSVYENVTGGVTGTATSTFSVSRGSSATFETTQGNNVYTIFKTDKPAIMTVGSGGDDHVMMPMTNYVYKRRNQYSRTINNTAPANVGTYVSHDTSGSNLPLFVLEIADGSGGDSAQGIGYEYLSDTFSWGNALSDYQIVAPYADTTVTVSYWQNSQWNVGEVHSLSGTQTDPAAVDRDGTNGFGVDGSDISGAADNLASGANLWKWESTKPIAVIINDTGNDEENLLGWMSNNHLRTSSNSTQSFVNLIDKDDRSRMKIYGKDLTTTIEYAGAKLSASDYVEFDGTDDYVNFYAPNLGTTTTVEMWCKLKSLSNVMPFGWNRYDVYCYGGEMGYNTSASDRYGLTSTQTTNLGLLNNWKHYVFEMRSDVSYTNNKIYVNGVEQSLSQVAGTENSGNRSFNSGNGRIAGWRADNNYRMSMDCASFKVYNRALTASEIQQNFNAHRGRFGI